MTPRQRSAKVLTDWLRFRHNRPSNPEESVNEMGGLITAAIREAAAERTEAAAKVVQKAPNERTWVCPEDAPAVSVLIPPSQADLAALIRAMKETE